MINDLNAFFNEIYGEEFGLLPTNASIKPVHVANGLGRALIGRTYNSDALTQFLRRSILNQTTRVQEERNSNRVIVERYRDAFVASDSGLIDYERLGTLRSLAEGVLNPDKAVFGEAGKSSYTLSNELLLTSDPSDNRSGAFLAELLTAGGAGDASRHLERLLSSSNDPWTTLASPILRFAPLHEPASAGSAGQLKRSYAPLSVGTTGSIASPTLAKLRASFDRLARFEEKYGSKLNSLRRMVTFACFTIHVHIVARYSEEVDGGPRPPILIDMFDGSRTSLRNASRASLRAAGDVLETCVLHAIRSRIADRVDTVGAEQMILELPTKVQARVHHGFDAYRHDLETTDLEALSEAFWQVATEKNHPVAFLTDLGRRAGYLTPWANSGRGGRLQKRYGMTTEFLETLVAATVEPDRPLDFPEFLDELRSNYGIVVGQRSDDQIVRFNNFAEQQFGTPTSVSEEDLRLNVEALRRAILEAGYAKAYADGQTVITTDPESLALL